MESEEYSFLNPSINIIRKTLKEIDNSYSNFWDILAELTQNSVDAINKKETKEGNIELEIDSIEKKIRIKDDGIGMQPDKIQDLLCPFATDKENDFDTIGEKGVGLKFVIFQSNSFNMKTSFENSNITSYVSIEDARNWKNGNSQDEKKFHKKEKKESFSGTEIIISDVDQEEIFNSSFDTIKFILRTKTVIGNVLSIFEKKEHIKVKLIMRDNNNERFEEFIPYKYWLPIEKLPDDVKTINFEEYDDWYKSAKRTDMDKRNYIANKVVFDSCTTKFDDNKEIRYWTCVFPSRSKWDEVSIFNKLMSSDVLDNKDKKMDLAQKIHRSGIYTSVKGMPTGIRIENPMTGSAGYWGNLFIIIEDKSLKFDIGRKNINSRNTIKMYQQIAKDIFNKFHSTVFKYLKEEEPDESYGNWDKNAVYQEIMNKPTLDSTIVKFRNVPDYQEASVAAIFYELIGANKIKRIEPITTGYKDKYDLYAHWNQKFVVIEFKSCLRNIIDDFSNLTKLSNELDYIVCWNVDSDDFTAFTNIFMEIETIPLSTIKKAIIDNKDNNNTMPIITHKLFVSRIAAPINVIDLKIVLQILEELN